MLPAASLARDHTDDGNLQEGHLPNILGDDDPLTSLFCFNARIGAHHIDQGNNGAVELLRLTHKPQGFAVTFRMGQTKVALDVVLGIPCPSGVR